MKEKIVTFGEIMLRMTRPNKERIIQGSAWKGLFGGSEANVAVSLAMFGDNVEYVTRLPNNKIGMACLNEIRKYNVGTDYIVHVETALVCTIMRSRQHYAVQALYTIARTLLSRPLSRG